MMQVSNRIKPEIAEEQCGFVEGKITTNTMFVLQPIFAKLMKYNNTKRGIPVLS